MMASHSVCVFILADITLTRMLRISGSDAFFFPNLWMLKDAIFMLAVERKDTDMKEWTHYWNFNEFVCVWKHHALEGVNGTVVCEGMCEVWQQLSLATASLA